MKIGIPRALLYYWYGRLWEDFWAACGLETVVSPETDRQMIKTGADQAIDEICLPVKIFLGHIDWLYRHLDDNDRIMLPHLIKVEPNAYICPKFMGLPDIVRHTLGHLGERILPVKSGPRRVDMLYSLGKAAGQAGLSQKAVSRAIQLIRTKYPHYATAGALTPPVQNEGTNGNSALRVGLLGHPYCLYDKAFNLNLLARLSDMDIQYFTPEMTPVNRRGQGTAKLNKELFWSVGRLQFDALDWMLNTEPPLQGFIQITPFACGTEAIIGDMLERRINEARIPLLRLNIEEHTGEAGLVTRVEAFVDLIHYQKRSAS